MECRIKRTQTSHNNEVKPNLEAILNSSHEMICMYIQPSNEVRNGIGEVSTLKVGVLRYDLTRSSGWRFTTQASVVWGPYQDALHQRYIKNH